MMMVMIVIMTILIVIIKSAVKYVTVLGSIWYYRILLRCFLEFYC